MRYSSMLTTVLLFLVVIGLHAQPESKTPTKAAGTTIDPRTQPEEYLKSVQIEPTKSSLLAYLRDRTTTEMERSNYRKLLEELASDDFDTREKASEQLLEIGIKAMGILRETTPVDEEVRRRIHRLLNKYDVNKQSLIHMAIISWLSKEPKWEIVRPILDFRESIPSDEFLNEQIQQLFTQLIRQQNNIDPIFQSALNSPNAGTRNLVALAIAEGLAKPLPALEKALQDSDSRLRLSLSRKLLQLGHRESVTTLLQLITDAPPEVAFEADEIFSQLYGDTPNLPATLTATDSTSRQKCRDAWTNWWTKQGNKVDVRKQLQGETIRGLTIVLEVDQVNNAGGNNGRVWECGIDGKQRWEWLNVSGPVELQVLTGGKYLLAEYYPARVTERDREGNILWESQRLPSSVVSAVRMPNGSTIVATLNSVFEIKRDRKQDPFPHPAGTIYQVRRGKNGNIFVLGGNSLVEYRPDRTLVHSTPVPDLSGWGGFDILPNGNFLIAHYNSKRGYSEIDPQGKILWTQTTSTQEPTRIHKLKNGHYLVAGGNQLNVVEYDADHKEVWRAATKGRPFSVQRY